MKKIYIFSLICTNFAALLENYLLCKLLNCIFSRFSRIPHICPSPLHSSFMWAAKTGRARWGHPGPWEISKPRFSKALNECANTLQVRHAGSHTPLTHSTVKKKRVHNGFIISFVCTFLHQD